MNRHSEKESDQESQREKIIGLGELSIRKSYYPELQRRIEELLRKNEELHAAYKELTATKEELQNNYNQLSRKEMALRESEEKYRQLYDSMMDAFASVEMDGRIVLFNPSFRTMIGYTPEEIRALTYNDLTPEQWHAAEAEIIEKQVLARGYSDNYEKEYRRKDGTVFPVELRTYLIRDESGRPRGMWAIVRDITERKRQEHILKTQLELGLALLKIHGLAETLDACLAAAIEISEMDAGGIYLVDRTSGSVDLAVSRNLGDEFVRSITHYPAGSVNAQMVIAGKPLYVPYDKTGVAHTPVQKREGLRAASIIPVTFGGRVIACLNIASHTLDEIPASARIALETIATRIGTAIERIRSEEALVMSEEKFRNLFNSASDAVAIHDPEGHFLEVNDAICNRLGYSRDELLAMTPMDIDSPEYRKKVHELISELLEKGPVVFETVHITKNGVRIPTEVSSRVINFSGNRAILSTGRDISERKRMETALQLARNKINLLNTVTMQDIQVAAFALSAYHELLRHLVTDEKAKTFLDKENALNRQILDSLNFAKNYEDMGVKPPRWQNVGQAFLFAISHMDFSRVAHNLQVDGLEVYADPLLEKVLSNMMENVLLYGEHATEVTVRYQEKPDGLVLFIEDNGAGIPAEEKLMIFDRGHGKKTGLGLFLAREVLSITGMTIRETGEPGKGARFEILVPAGGYRFAPAPGSG
ncbi:MAG: PAS domain S-box protein [Methanoregula sp.]|nr:PAS domain S-box protein [Methanoregula sp.]